MSIYQLFLPINVQVVDPRGDDDVGQLDIFRTNRYSENCWPCTPPPVLAATVKPAFNNRVMACTLLSLQYPFNGNRTKCLESTGVQDTAGRPADGSSAEWPVSGNTSSRTAWSPDNITRSPRSGLTWTDTHSYWSFAPERLLLGRLAPFESQPFVRLHFIRSRFRFSNCLHMAVTTINESHWLIVIVIVHENCIDFRYYKHHLHIFPFKIII